jgi:hypothetical protein
MDKRLDYYRVLHVQPDAPEEIIRSSYRTLMTKLRRHPDLGGDHLTATTINEAYAVLSNPAKRAANDDACQSVAASPEPAASAPEPNALCQFCGAAHGFRGRIHDSATCTTCNTPLAPAEHKRLDAGQRAVGRVPRRLALAYFTNWPGMGPYPAETRDVSLHGLRFVTHTALPLKKLIKVECEALVALVRIVACEENDARDWRWLIRSEYVTVRFRRARGGFLATRA